MNKIEEKNTIHLYKDIKKLVAKAFCEKYDMYVEFELPGGAGYVIGDYSISVEDMITSLEEDYTLDQFIEWYDYALDIHMNNSNNDSKKDDKHIINLKNYIKYHINNK